MIEGFTNRIEKEINNCVPSTTKVKIVAQPDRNYTAWIGGSVLASLGISRLGVTREEYDDEGVGIVHSKFI